MKQRSFLDNPEIRVPLTGLIAWAIPGGGHLFIGEKVRGAIFLLTIALTFWGGVAIGGVKHTVDPVHRKLWFVGQICAGGHAVGSLFWSRAIPTEQVDSEGYSELRAYGRIEEIAVVYTAIAGMLNVLIILDVLVRAEKQAAQMAPKKAGTGRTR